MSAICEYITNPAYDDYSFTSSINSIWASVDSSTDLTQMLDSVFEGVGTVPVYSFRFNIEQCVFLNNYSGMQGTAVYIKQMNKIRMFTTNFVQNGATFTQVEFANSPLALYMTNRPISFFDPTQVCQDEFQYIDYCTLTTPRFSLI